MAYFLAILITIVASTSCSVGKALQKEATRHLPRFSGTDWKILQQYLQSRLWLSGLGADLGGGVLQVFAFAMAPVSVVQPVSGIGLVGLAVWSHFFLKEHLQSWEWAAVATAGFGTLGLGLSSTATNSNNDPSSTAGSFRMLFVLLLAGAGVASITIVRRKRVQKIPSHHRRPMDKTAAALYGLQAGGCFGLSAVTCRIGFLLSSSSSISYSISRQTAAVAAAGVVAATTTGGGGTALWLAWILLGLLGSIFLSSIGFVLQTMGLKEGSTVVVCTCAAVSSMVTGVLIGMIGLAEPLPDGKSALLIRITSWAAVLVGVIALANGAGGWKELLAMLLGQLPPRVWKAMPVAVAVRLKSWSSLHGRVELPELSMQGVGSPGPGPGNSGSEGGKSHNNSSTNGVVGGTPHSNLESGAQKNKGGSTNMFVSPHRN
jgi:drug/metabolite transporter (DMT)-like permease